MEESTALVKQEIELKEIPEKARNGVMVGPRYEAIALLQENGFTRERTAAALGITERSVAKIKNQVLPKYDLTSRKYVKLAADAVKQALQGKAVGDADPPKMSVVVDTAKMVYDRYQPIKSSDITPTSVTFTRININVF